MLFYEIIHNLNAREQWWIYRGGRGEGVCASPLNLPRGGAEGMQGGANFFQVLKKILFVRKGYLAMACR